MNDYCLYWLDLRTGSGYPTKRWPDPVTYEEARAIVEKHRKDLRGHELRFEPLDVHLKYTKNHKEAR